MSELRRGIFLTFEGTEGSGKTTQAALLAVRLRNEGLTVVETREPGGTPTGEAIRALVQHDSSGECPVDTCEALLFAASRAQHVSKLIRPALCGGAWVVCDRFVDSSIAYQSYGRGLALDDVRRINAFAMGQTLPDRTILLDVGREEGRRRLRARASNAPSPHDRIECEAESFHERVRRGYLALADAAPDRIRLIPSSACLAVVQALVWEAVRELVEAYRNGRTR